VVLLVLCAIVLPLAMLSPAGAEPAAVEPVVEAPATEGKSESDAKVDVPEVNETAHQPDAPSLVEVVEREAELGPPIPISTYELWNSAVMLAEKGLLAKPMDEKLLAQVLRPVLEISIGYGIPGRQPLPLGGTPATMPDANVDSVRLLRDKSGALPANWAEIIKAPLKNSPNVQVLLTFAVPKELRERRDRAVAKAHADLRDGVVKLAEEFPYIKKAENWNHLTDVKVPEHAEQLKLELSFSSTNTEQALVADQQRFRILIDLEQPESGRNRPATSQGFTCLGLMGQLDTRADNRNLETALWRLRHAALETLDKLDDQAAAIIAAENPILLQAVSSKGLQERAERLLEKALATKPIDEERLRKILRPMVGGTIRYRDPVGTGPRPSQVELPRKKAGEVPEEWIDRITEPMKDHSIVYADLKLGIRDEFLAARDAEFTKADEKLRTGLYKLGDQFPFLKTPTWEQLLKPAAGEPLGRLQFNYRDLNGPRSKDTGPLNIVPKHEQFEILVVLETPNIQRQMATSSIFPALGLTGAFFHSAGDPNLEAALTKLVVDSQKPFRELDQRAAEIIAKENPILLAAVPGGKESADGEKDSAKLDPKKQPQPSPVNPRPGPSPEFMLGQALSTNPIDEELVRIVLRPATKVKLVYANPIQADTSTPRSEKGEDIADLVVVLTRDEAGEVPQDWMDRIEQPLSKYSKVETSVVFGVPKQFLVERDTAFAKAEKDLRQGIIKLAEKFPAIKQSPQWSGVIDPKPQRQNESLVSFYVASNKNSDRTVDNSSAAGKQFSIYLSVQKPPKEPVVDIALIHELRYLGVEASWSAEADDKELAAALSKLLVDAVAPLQKLDKKSQSMVGPHVFDPFGGNGDGYTWLAKRRQMIERAKAIKPPRLSFRIVADPNGTDKQPPNLPADWNGKDELVRLGPEPARKRGDKFQWFAVQGEKDIPKFAIVAEHNKQRYVLLSTAPEDVMLPGTGKDAWSIISVSQKEGRFTEKSQVPAEIQVKLDAIGGGKLANLTKNNVLRWMAVLVDDQVVTAPLINTQISQHFSISSRNSKEEREAIAAALKSSIDPAAKATEEKTDEPAKKSETTKEGTAKAAEPKEAPKPEPVPKEGDAAKAGTPKAAKAEKEAKLEKPLVTIGKETTVVTEPLLPSGYPDYLTALNNEFSKGVTPENNAAVVLVRMINPTLVIFANPDKGEQLTKSGADYYRLLGIDPLPRNGKYLQSWYEYFRSVPTNKLPQLTAEDRARMQLLDGDTVDEQSLRGYWEERLYEMTFGRPWTAKENPHVAAWLKSQEVVLAKLADLKTRTKFFSPAVMEQDDAPLVAALLIYVNEFRQLALVLESRAQLAIGEGRLDDAITDLENIHRMATYYSDPGFTVEWLIGRAIQSAGLRPTNAIVFHPKVTKEQLQRLRTFYQQSPLNYAPVRMYSYAERYSALSAACYVAQTGTTDFLEYAFRGSNPIRKLVRGRQIGYTARRLLWDFDSVLRKTNALYDKLVEIQSIPDPVKRAAAWKEYDERLRLMAKDLAFEPANLLKNSMTALTEEGRSKLLAQLIEALFMPAIVSLDIAGSRSQTQTNLQDLAIALALYKNDRGQFPKKLDELVPKYVKEIPPDRYGGKPLVYRSSGDGVLLYSFGHDGKDSGGHYDNDSDFGDDIAFFTENMRPAKPNEDAAKPKEADTAKPKEAEPAKTPVEAK